QVVLMRFREIVRILIKARKSRNCGDVVGFFFEHILEAFDSLAGESAVFIRPAAGDETMGIAIGETQLCVCQSGIQFDRFLEISGCGLIVPSVESANTLIQLFTRLESGWRLRLGSKSGKE